MINDAEVVQVNKGYVQLCSFKGRRINDIYVLLKYSRRNEVRPVKNTDNLSKYNRFPYRLSDSYISCCTRMRLLYLAFFYK